MRLRPAILLFVLLVAIPSVRANSSNSLMDVSPDGKLLLVANPDNGTVTVVDTASRKKLHEIKVGDKPEGRHLDRPGPARRRHGLSTRIASSSSMPRRAGGQEADGGRRAYGIVASEDGSRAWVTHEYPGTVSEIDLKAQKVLRADSRSASFVRGLAPSRRREAAVCHRVLHGRPARGRSGERQGGRFAGRGTRPTTWPGRSWSIRSGPRRTCRTSARGSTSSTAAARSSRSCRSATWCRPTARSGARVAAGHLQRQLRNVVTNPWEAALSPDGKRSTRSTPAPTT